MKVPKTFIPEKDLTDILKKALKEYEEEKKPQPADLSKLDYKAIELEYADGTREVFKADILKYYSENYSLHRFDKHDLCDILRYKDKDQERNPILVVDEKNPKRITKMIDIRFVRAIRTNYLEF